MRETVRDIGAGLLCIVLVFALSYCFHSIT